MKQTNKTLFLLLFGLFSLTGCDALQQTTNTKTYEVAANEWKKNNITDYEFVWEKSCFCAFRGPSIIVVENNKITKILDPETRKPRLGVELEWFQTIDELMAWIEETSAQKPALLKAEYDSTYGFPTSIEYDGSKMIADDEFLATIKNFTSYHLR